MKNVFLTGEIHPDAIAVLSGKSHIVVSRSHSDCDLRAGIEHADAVIVRHPLPSDIFDHAPRLRCAVRHGAGMDMIPVDAANGKGILLANVPGVNAEYVAEHAVGQMLNLARRLPEVSEAFRKRSWDHGKKLAMGGSGLRGKTVGIVGLGSIGSKLASICRNGFSMEVVSVLRHSQSADGHTEVKKLPLGELLAVSDFVVLCCPLTRETEGMIDAAALGMMKPTAYLINVARGRIIETPALVEAVTKGGIAGAALDVYESTPLDRSSALFEIKGLHLTPHVAAVTAESMKVMAVESAKQVLDVLEGRTPEHWVNRAATSQIFARWRHLDEVDGNTVTFTADDI